MKKQRKHYTPEEKVAMLRRRLLERVPISELCDKQRLQPTVFYRWQKEFFENGAAAFQPKAQPNHSAEQERIAYLEKPAEKWGPQTCAGHSHWLAFFPFGGSEPMNAALRRLHSVRQLVGG